MTITNYQTKDVANTGKNTTFVTKEVKDVAKKDFKCRVDLGPGKPKKQVIIKKDEPLPDDVPSKIMTNLKTEGVI